MARLPIPTEYSNEIARTIGWSGIKGAGQGTKDDLVDEIHMELMNLIGQRGKVHTPEEEDKIQQLTAMLDMLSAEGATGIPHPNLGRWGIK